MYDALEGFAGISHKFWAIVDIALNLPFRKYKQQNTQVSKPMKQKIAHITLVVRDYDEAIEFYTQKLDFVLLEDTRLNDQKRWVIVSPPGTNGCSLLLAKAASLEQGMSIGNQTGGRVFLFLYTDNFWRDYQRMLAKNIEFIRSPKQEIYGTVAVFKDLYGNQWDLLEPFEQDKLI